VLTRGELVQRVLAGIDRAELAAIERRFARHGFAKYFDVERWVRINAARAQLLGLDDGRRRYVLDLGAGFGYFLLVCRELGHDVQGVDLPNPIYQAVTKALGVPIVEQGIEPRSSLPVSPPYDVVTAHMVCFNGHGTAALWGTREWTPFLNRVIGATLHLELNREKDGTLFPPRVAELFGDRGAVINGRHVIFSRVRGGP